MSCICTWPLCLWPVQLWSTSPQLWRKEIPYNNCWTDLYEFCWLSQHWPPRVTTVMADFKMPGFPGLGFHQSQSQNSSIISLSWRMSSHNWRDSWWWSWGRRMLPKEMTVRRRGMGDWEPRPKKLVCFKPHPLRMASNWLRSQGWPWILDYSVPISQVLGLHPCATRPCSKYSYIISLGNVFKIPWTVLSLSFIVENLCH